MRKTFTVTGSSGRGGRFSVADSSELAGRDFLLLVRANFEGFLSLVRLNFEESFLSLVRVNFEEGFLSQVRMNFEECFLSLV